MGIDYMSGQWGANGFETEIDIPKDGSAHTWRLDYDPDATPPTQWPDPKLKKYLTTSRQTLDEIWQKAVKDEPGVTKEQIQQRLAAALAEGLVALVRRSWGTWWFIDEGVADVRGAITLEVDGRAYKSFIDKEHRGQHTQFDRFGIFNFQLYSRSFYLAVSDLIVNGQPIDLSRDPGWQGYFNRVQFVEQDFQRQDFGYSQTNWAGGGIGEIGGTFYRVEPNDPGCGYYADDVGKLTLDDPLHFDGNICFTRGGTDAAMFFGFFNDYDKKIELATDAKAGFLIDGLLGLEIAGPTRVGYYLNAVCVPDKANKRVVEGPVFLPTGVPTHFSFDYDPNAAGGDGAVTVKLGDQSFVMELRSAVRAKGATFDHFGLASVRAGGKYVTVYLDDLTYTARRGPDWKPPAFEQKTTIVPYPKGGRAY